MNKLLTTPLLLRQLTTKHSVISSTKRTVCYNSSILTKHLTSISCAEFHHRRSISANITEPIFQNTDLSAHLAWRHYSRGPSSKSGKNQSSSAASSSDDGNDDDDKKDKSSKTPSSEKKKNAKDRKRDEKIEKETKEILNKLKKKNDEKKDATSNLAITPDGGGVKTTEKTSIAEEQEDDSDWYSSGDDEYESDEDKSLVTPFIPPFFPRLPIIATAYPVFPKFMKVYEVSDPRMIRLLEHNFKAGCSYAGVFTRKNGDVIDHSVEVKSLDDMHAVGSFVQITEMTKEGDKLRFVATAHRRIAIKNEIFLDQQALDRKDADITAIKQMTTTTKDPKWNALMVDTENVKDVLPDVHSDKYKAISMELVKTIRDIIMANTLIRDNLYQLLGNNLRVNDSAAYLADISASITSAKPDEMQAVMNERDVGKRMELALELLMKEKTILELQKKIGKEVEDKIKQAHREFMLREQLKALKKELGLHKEDNVALEEKFRKSLEGKVVPEAVLNIINEEIKKLGYLENASTEFS